MGGDDGAGDGTGIGMRRLSPASGSTSSCVGGLCSRGREGACRSLGVVITDPNVGAGLTDREGGRCPRKEVAKVDHVSEDLGGSGASSGRS